MAAFKYLAVVIALSLATIAVDGAEDAFYTAAVYELALNFTPNEVSSREDALRLMRPNLDILGQQVEQAKKQMADIFLFPEYGLYNALHPNRAAASFYTEVIPDPNHENFCPCLNDTIRDGQEVLHELSCLSQRHSIYLAINMADKQPCSTDDNTCPPNGHYQYNTEVVFDRKGCLVAKYHKQKLFESEKKMWDTPKSVEHSYFDTEFGRFGLMICFDAVFKDPAIELVETYNVTDIIFSTAWMNVFPHYASVAYHSGWARTMRVNYLAANIHDVSNRMVGSGVYSPEGILSYTFNTTTDLGKLVVARVPINQQKAARTNPGQPKTHSHNAESFQVAVFGDKFTAVALNRKVGSVSVCSGSVCCSLDYNRSSVNENYAIGAFDGMHTLEGMYYFEICLLVKCNRNFSKCDGAQTAPTNTIFYSYHLSGNMSTPYAFPEVVEANFNFTADWSYANDGKIKHIEGKNKKILSVVLMGRNFDRDPKPPMPEVVSNTESSKAARTFSSMALLAVCMLFWIEY